MGFFRNCVGALGLGLAAVSMGQLPGIPTPANMDYMPAIFMNPKVAKDLQLSDAVRQKEVSIIMQQGMQMISLAQQTGKAADASKSNAMAKMQDASLAPLSAAQRIRYHQLSLQYFGPMALVDPHVATKLSLTTDQRLKLANSFSAAAKALSASAKQMQMGASSDPMGAMKKMRTVQNSMRARQVTAARAILTSSQWTRWDAMQGKKLPGVDDLFGGMMGE